MPKEEHVMGKDVKQQTEVAAPLVSKWLRAGGGPKSYSQNP